MPSIFETFIREKKKKENNSDSNFTQIRTQIHPISQTFASENDLSDNHSGLKNSNLRDGLEPLPNKSSLLNPSLKPTLAAKLISFLSTDKTSTQIFKPLVSSATKPPSSINTLNQHHPNPNLIPSHETSYKSQKPKIDPRQIPSPVAVHALNQELFLNTDYITSTKTGVPLVNTQFTCIDEGNSNPNFVRMSMYNIPNTDKLLKVSKLPLGLVVQPLANIGPNDTPLQIVDFGDEGPIRCLRCKTYVNPYMVFIDGGKRFVCNLCKNENDVPDDYFCNLDMAGRRLDWDLRPELKCGSTEFVATKEFISPSLGPISYVFAIDVSLASVKSGLVRSCANAIKQTLYTGVGLPLGVQFGLITYDKNVYLYNLNSKLEEAQAHLISDNNKKISSLSDGFLVDPYVSRRLIISLLDNLPKKFSKNKEAKPILETFIYSVFKAFKGKRSKLFLFQTDFIYYQSRNFRSQDNSNILDFDNENPLCPNQESFFRDMGLKFNEEGIGFKIYLFPNKYTNALSISLITDVTSGELSIYQSYNIDRDGPRFTSDLKYDVTRDVGFNGVLHIRCSDGLRIAEYYGNMFMRNHVDVELPFITSDTSLAATLKHDGKLNENEDVYFQISLLYTSSDGRRLIRIHNLAIPCTTLIGNMFKYADIDTSVNLLARMALAETKSLSLINIKDNLQDQCVQILSAYRKNCAKGSAQSKLILPEAFKLLPIYILSILKSPAFRSGINVQIDNRIFGMILLNNVNVKQSMRYFYPKIAPIHEIYPPLEDNTQVMPPLVRASYSLLDPQGIYLLQSNSSVLYLWIGRQADSSILNSLFGVPSVEQINPIMSQLPEVEGSKLSLYARRVSYALINGMYTLPTESFFEDLSKNGNRVYEPIIQVVGQSIDSNEALFSDLLVEDKNNDSMSHEDFLCHIHALILKRNQNKK
ncbi:Protein transport protein Sec24C [Smittium mucronatum]|uniref:Protein transport protein Sec24C n=1 Tax=Smittium mucronatum TaxID=133383 RepID=A0A1R0GTL3_9FUNG|nr:Protein transport protein Sec24C [Smittium mucronatum]